jgi:hypothetical protein
MAFRPAHSYLASALFCVTALAATPHARAQVFVVGEKTATADISTDFHPTKVELSEKPLSELDRRELIRDLTDEQGFAHRALPLADNLTLMANGNMVPGGDAYKQMIYKKGQSAGPGDRVVITALNFKPDRLILDINGGPYLKHRFLRHIELNGNPVVADDGAEVTGCRVTLIFEGGIPDITAPEVKALLDPVIDFGVKTSAQAFADALPPFLKDAIDHHDVLVGMNRKMVLAAMGAPESKVRELVPGSTDRHYEEWIFGRVPQTVRFVRIEGDRVTQVKIAALGQPIALHTENELHGYLDPEDTHEVAMGDAVQSNDDDAHSKGTPPTILKPGEVGAGSSAQRVQYPVPTKEQPIPAAPGSPADPNANVGTLGGTGTGMGNGTGMGHGAPGSSQGANPNDPLGSIGPGGTGMPSGPGSRVN